jgi:hypothetical protein
MVKLRLDQKVIERLAAFLQSGPSPAPRSNHWRHFSRLNHITADVLDGSVTFSAGAGFDSDYEFNFRRYSLRETVGKYWRRTKGTDTEARFSDAFASLWPNGSPVSRSDAERALGSPMTAHKILATHYASLLLPSIPDKPRMTYVEIGPGAGYLAALIHRFRPGLVIAIDLPEILPFSFLALHRAFPHSPFWLPNEMSGSPLELPDQGLVFLTTGQARQLPDACMNLGVNTASFGEMLPEHVANYFALLRRITKPTGLFFTCNRVEKWMDRESAALSNNVPGRGIPIRFDRYPWLQQDQDLFFGPSAFHAMVQPENPTLQRLCRLAPASTLQRNAGAD